MVDKLSFASASSLPSKLLCNHCVCEATERNQIPPYHVQIMPTNRCGLRCSFCSCDNRDKKLELDIATLETKMTEFVRFGAKSVTISGGGDPLLYKDINRLIQFLYDNSIGIGLVTNGTAMGNLTIENWKKVDWCRISMSDEATLDTSILSSIIDECKKVDWAFSYVLLKKTNFETLKKTIEYANNHNFTHVRVVDDILDEIDYGNIDKVKELVKVSGIDDSRVFFQGRKNYSCGTKNCYVSLLRPVLAADGFIYPCCGAQYARNTPDLDYNKEMSMGDDIADVWANQKMFDGSVCKKCYYGDYNSVLDIFWNSCGIKHARHL